MLTVHRHSAIWLAAAMFSGVALIATPALATNALPKSDTGKTAGSERAGDDSNSFVVGLVGFLADYLGKQKSADSTTFERDFAESLVAYANDWLAAHPTPISPPPVGINDPEPVRHPPDSKPDSRRHAHRTDPFEGSPGKPADEKPGITKPIGVLPEPPCIEKPSPPTELEMRAFCKGALLDGTRQAELDSGDCHGWSSDLTAGVLPALSTEGLPWCEDKRGKPAEPKGPVINVAAGQSIQDAIDKAKPGDTIVVSPGEYNDEVLLNKDGVKVICAETHQCSIRVTDAGHDGIVRIDANGATFSGFEIDGGGTSLTGADVVGQKNVLSNNKIHDINTSGSATGSAVGTGGEDNQIVGNTISNVGNDHLDHGIYLYDGSATISDNTVSDTSGFGIHLWHTPGDGIVITGNTAFRNDEGGITIGAGEHDGASASNIVVENNHTYDNGDKGGISEAGTVSNNVYRNNNTEDGINLKNGQIEG